jgi:hypothetical protein
MIKTKMKDIENKAWNFLKIKMTVGLTTKIKVSKNLFRIKV